MGPIFRVVLLFLGLMWLGSGFTPRPESQSRTPGLEELKEKFGSAIFANSPALIAMRQRGRERLQHGFISAFPSEELAFMTSKPLIAKPVARQTRDFIDGLSVQLGVQDAHQDIQAKKI